MSFQFKKCFLKNGQEVKGLFEIVPSVFSDNRGYFLETFSEKEFFEHGIDVKFVQDNQSLSKKGVLRGLHFQTNHPQGKLVKTLFGSIYDVAVDLRKGSDTFGKFYGTILHGEEHNMVYIPQGFAHGFYVLSDQACISYKCSDFYDPLGEDGIMWNDKTIGVNWTDMAWDCYPQLSEKDKKRPCFDINKKYFDINGKWQD